jgi:hypothetical protein
MAFNPLKEEGIPVEEQHVERHGHDYRLEMEGPHPIEELRAREMAGA